MIAASTRKLQPLFQHRSKASAIISQFLHEWLQHPLESFSNDFPTLDEPNNVYFHFVGGWSSSPSVAKTSFDSQFTLSAESKVSLWKTKTHQGWTTKTRTAEVIAKSQGLKATGHHILQALVVSMARFESESRWADHHPRLGCDNSDVSMPLGSSSPKLWLFAFKTSIFEVTESAVKGFMQRVRCSHAYNFLQVQSFSWQGNSYVWRSEVHPSEMLQHAYACPSSVLHLESIRCIAHRSRSLKMKIKVAMKTNVSLTSYPYT